MSEQCIIKITMQDTSDIDSEDIVKNLWGRMYPWFTNRHGVRQGNISLNHGTIEIEWSYSEDE